MAGYGVFASFYDRLTENVDYAAWADYLLGLFSRFQGKKPHLLLDLACGSGSLSEQLIARGVDVIGADGSPEMLMEAQEKSAPFGEKWMLLCQDMRDLDLYGTVDGAVCMLDALNHLTETRDLEEVFHRLGLFIEPGGLLIFDVNTPYKHREVLGDHAFVYEEPDFYCVWQNRYLPRRNETEITLDFFVPEGEERYNRYREQFRERAYSLKTWRELLEKAGFEVLAQFGELTENAPKEDEQRVVLVAKNHAISQK